MPNPCARWRASMSSSTNEPGSSRRSMRSRGELAPLVLPLDGRRAPRVQRLLTQARELGEPLLDRVRRRDRRRPLVAVERLRLRLVLHLFFHGHGPKATGSHCGNVGRDGPRCARSGRRDHPNARKKPTLRGRHKYTTTGRTGWPERTPLIIFGAPRAGVGRDAAGTRVTEATRRHPPHMSNVKRPQIVTVGGQGIAVSWATGRSGRSGSKGGGGT